MGICAWNGCQRTSPPPAVFTTFTSSEMRESSVKVNFTRSVPAVSEIQNASFVRNTLLCISCGRGEVAKMDDEVVFVAGK